MADGTIPFAAALGLTAQDSIDVHRKRFPISHSRSYADLSPGTHLGFLVSSKSPRSSSTLPPTAKGSSPPMTSENHQNPFVGGATKEPSAAISLGGPLGSNRGNPKFNPNLRDDLRVAGSDVGLIAPSLGATLTSVRTSESHNQELDQKFGEHNPKDGGQPSSPQQKSSPARILQQVFQQEIDTIKHEEFIAGKELLQPSGNSSSTLLYNQCGAPYSSDDPNLGYSPEELVPAFPILNKHTPTHPYNKPHPSDLMFRNQLRNGLLCSRLKALPEICNCTFTQSQGKVKQRS